MDFRKLRRAPTCSEKLSEHETAALMRSLEHEVLEAGARCNFNRKDGNFTMSGCQLSDELVEGRGLNISGRTGRRSRCLGWNDWVAVNNAINETFDRLELCGEVTSLHGDIVVRDGTRAYSRKDWEPAGRQKVGSVMEPCPLKEAYRPEARPAMLLG